MSIQKKKSKKWKTGSTVYFSVLLISQYPSAQALRTPSRNY